MSGATLADQCPEFLGVEADGRLTKKNGIFRSMGKLPHWEADGVPFACLMEKCMRQS